jgi:hypothetical protein
MTDRLYFVYWTIHRLLANRTHREHLNSNLLYVFTYSNFKIQVKITFDELFSQAWICTGYTANLSPIYLYDTPNS